MNTKRKILPEKKKMKNIATDNISILTKHIVSMFLEEEKR